jgi:hypothetical protein
MHKPDSRVVCWEGDEQPTQTGKDGSVATGRVGKVETCSARVKDAGAGAEDEEVVTRVRNQYWSDKKCRIAELTRANEWGEEEGGSAGPSE